MAVGPRPQRGGPVIFSERTEFLGSWGLGFFRILGFRIFRGLGFFRILGFRIFRGFGILGL